ncbi:MAG: hypothetical protein QXM75_01695 [Candidatus Diapherotrites archaeon]
MGEEKKDEKKAAAPSKIDETFKKLSAEASKSVGNFAAFLFILLFIGILIGTYVASRHARYIEVSIIAPLLLGIIAYYNREIAIAILALFLVALIFL